MISVTIPPLLNNSKMHALGAVGSMLFSKEKLLVWKMNGAEEAFGSADQSLLFRGKRPGFEEDIAFVGH